jgi:shikimate kinase
MKRILITGMSGTGKSAVVIELARRGYRAIDLDTPEWSHWVLADPDDALTPGDGQDWVWQEDRVRELLSGNGEDYLFVSGCAENMRKLFDLIDTIVLLSAPIDTLMHRLAKRTAKGYGHAAEERCKIAKLVETIEPLLRQSAHHEIDTTRPVAETVTKILTLMALA